MTKPKKDTVSQLPSSAVGPGEGCTLELSADGKWMRLIVSGKLTAAFNVVYVQKTLDEGKTSGQKQSRKQADIPVDL